MVTRGKLLHDPVPARLKLRKFDIIGWLKLKLLQYNISSCLYMLDTWERILFNFFFLVVLMLSVFLFVAYLSTASTTFLSGNLALDISCRLLSDVCLQPSVPLLHSASSFSCSSAVHCTNFDKKNKSGPHATTGWGWGWGGGISFWKPIIQKFSSCKK